ncbi:glutaredoxin family protein [Vibrio sonorensis]|uniref:glutaredoxin family protein n=1 Tax=Vibrio sonorensis TaxID=1004316 RepID=UPI000A0111E6|nr:glutaredoxin family protein [Vibrio sonorensis]
MKTVTLYSTEGCHLCEMASALYEQLEVEAELEVVDIAYDDKLFESYGVTIPVLNFEGSEINWPFDIEQLSSWLEKNGITYHK